MKANYFAIKYLDYQRVKHSRHLIIVPKVLKTINYGNNACPISAQMK